MDMCGHVRVCMEEAPVSLADWLLNKDLALLRPKDPGCGAEASEAEDKGGEAWDGRPRYLDGTGIRDCSSTKLEIFYHSYHSSHCYIAIIVIIAIIVMMVKIPNSWWL